MIVCVSIILGRTVVPCVITPVITLAVKTPNGSGVFRSIFCHCEVGHFIVGQLIGVLSSLLANSSCMASEASRQRTTRASERQSRVGWIS